MTVRPQKFDEISLDKMDMDLPPHRKLGQEPRPAGVFSGGYSGGPGCNLFCRNKFEKGWRDIRLNAVVLEGKLRMVTLPSPSQEDLG